VEDLPFKLEDMPSNYGGFRDRVQKLEIRKTIEALDQLKGMPSRGDVEIGDVPSLMDLGLNPSSAMPQVCLLVSSVIINNLIGFNCFHQWSVLCRMGSLVLMLLW